ncbi:unnamed protein product [Ectocarpus sp. 6 AP-2014]|uniref:50S ribosomal protein L28 n=1 Tax=Ectocarpus siliculosus TaxID=2880 RepID=D7G312_ECTSI|nr:50S ribosomal protein L28 [Ectocarpus siliculosus]|eukprot:CBJ48869.1 50S ribosomal protein L28 [Ectocarpus siliculosus]
MKLFAVAGAMAVLFCQLASGFMIAPSAFAGSSVVSKSSATSPTSSLQMRARNCDLLGKKPNRKARVVTFSHKRIHKVQHLNLQWRKMYWEEGKRFVRLRLSTKAIKTIDKYGLNKAAKKFNLDLVKFTA